MEKVDKELDSKINVKFEKLDYRIDNMKEETAAQTKKQDTLIIINKTKIDSMENAMTHAKAAVDEAKARVNTVAEKLGGLAASIDNTKKHLAEEILSKYKETQSKIENNQQHALTLIQEFKQV